MGTLRGAGLLLLIASHTHPIPSAFSCFSITLWIIKDEANEGDEESGNEGLGFEIKNLTSTPSSVNFIYLLFMYVCVYICVCIYICIFNLGNSVNSVSLSGPWCPYLQNGNNSILPHEICAVGSNVV